MAYGSFEWSSKLTIKLLWMKTEEPKCYFQLSKWKEVIANEVDFIEWDFVSCSTKEVDTDYWKKKLIIMTLEDKWEQYEFSASWTQATRWMYLALTKWQELWRIKLLAWTMWSEDAKWVIRMNKWITIYNNWTKLTKQKTWDQLLSEWLVEVEETRKWNQYYYDKLEEYLTDIALSLQKYENKF